LALTLKIHGGGQDGTLVVRTIRGDLAHDGRGACFLNAG